MIAGLPECWLGQHCSQPNCPTTKKKKRERGETSPINTDLRLRTSRAFWNLSTETKHIEKITLLEPPTEACEGHSVFKKEVEFHPFFVGWTFFTLKPRNGAKGSTALSTLASLGSWPVPPSGDASSSALQVCAMLGRWQRHPGMCPSGSGLLGAQAPPWGKFTGLVSRLATLVPSVRQWPIAHALLASKENHEAWSLNHFCPQTITLSSWTLSGYWEVMMPSAKDLDNLLLIVLHSSEALVTLGRLSVYLGNFNVLCFRILVLTSSGGCWSGSLAQVCKLWFSCIASLMPRAHIHVQNPPHSPDPHGELWGKVPRSRLTAGLCTFRGSPVKVGVQHREKLVCFQACGPLRSTSILPPAHLFVPVSANKQIYRKQKNTVKEG